MRKIDEPKPQPAAVARRGLDGYMRLPADEADLNQIVYHTFNTPAGERCLAYLRAITVDCVLDSSQPDTVLRYQEGMRYVVNLLERRMGTLNQLRRK